MKKKKEVIISLVLAFCMVLGVVAVLLVERAVGTPVFYDGKMADIRVRITEVCSSNRSILPTDSGEYHDYIELYNEGETFNLADFGLAKDTSNSRAYTFGDVTFEAGSYMVIFLDGVNVPFKLSKDGGEYVALVSWDGTVIDEVTTVSTAPDQVMLFTEDDYSVSDKASPGHPNTDDGVTAFLASSGESMALAINEIFTSNTSTLPDGEGEYHDIIEIKNVSSQTVSAGGYFISDSFSDRARCALPATELEPGQIVLIFASGKGSMHSDTELHTDFRLSQGEEVILSCGSKYTCRTVELCDNGFSQSLDSEGKYEIAIATPGYENTEAGREALELSRINTEAPLVISEVLLSVDLTPYGGALRDVIEICNLSESPISSDGWFISDSKEEPYKYALPARTLAQGECMLLYAQNGEGENVCGFALSSGESVYLTGPDYKRGEYVSCAPAGRGQSRSLSDDKGEAVYVDTQITLGYPNTDGGRADYLSSVRPDRVEISEVVSSNASFIPGPYATYHDFIELHNRTSESISLDGWYLSDDPEEPKKGGLSGLVIEPYGYAVIILSSDGINTPSGYHRVPFGINASGETLVLCCGDQVVDSVAVPSLSRDTSYGRAAGADGFSVLTSVSPGYANATGVAQRAAAPTASVSQGVYAEPLTVSLVGEGNIYYTLDCTEPSADSTLYTGPITVSSTTIIRCISLIGGKNPSEITDLSYIVGEGDTLEVVSIVTEPDNLFNTYTGIYETGQYASNVFPYFGANYHFRWERECTVSFFDKAGGGFYESCGIRIFGGYSRALPKKSFSLFFRSVYGASELNYQVFEDEPLSSYEALVLRNTGQDFYRSSMRDAMLTSIADDYLNIDTQNCRPVVLYLNGRYWGIYFIREKMNENYVAGHYNVDADTVTVASAGGWGTPGYRDILDFVQMNDMTKPENYSYVCSLMDVENYIDYIVAQIIIANSDNGNIKFFTYTGGKWRWLMYDVDQSFSNPASNTVFEHLNPEGTGASNMFPTVLIRSLLTNSEFKDKFLSEFVYQLENVWTVENVNRYIDTFSGMIVADMNKECIRWEKDYSAWERSVQGLRNFIAGREFNIIQHLKYHFALEDEEMRAYGFNI